MSDRPIQRYTGNLPATQQGTSIMTSQGPATIQIIDMPSGALGPANPTPGTARKKPGGINVISAVMRRWWLVVLVFAIVGGAAWFAGANLVKPNYEGRAKVSYVDTQLGSGLGFMTMHRAILLLNGPAIVTHAWDRQDMKQLFPKIANRDFNNPAEVAAVLPMTQNMVDTDDPVKGNAVIDVISLQPTQEQAKAVADAYADAIKWYCETSVRDESGHELKTFESEAKANRKQLVAMTEKLETLKRDNGYAINQQMFQAALQKVANLESEKIDAGIAVATAKANVEAIKNGTDRAAALEKGRLQNIKDEKGKDSLLKAYLDMEAAAAAKKSELMLTMKPEHPEVVAQEEAIQRSAKMVADREKQIEEICNKKIAEAQKLDARDTLEQAQVKLREAEAKLASYAQQEKQLDQESRKFAAIQAQILYVQNEASAVAERQKLLDEAVADATRSSITMPNAVFKVEQNALVSLKEDKRIKVQAGGLVGGLFLGILLALLVDKFDKRLRDPRDIEPLFGATLLGTIPRIQELKRIKGEQARNLIAEEFRIIRTQVLFGNPNLTQKLIGITSPNPGDGKTSLAVNLAISIAKAGRRVLLIDGDLRKPDVHRVFNVTDTPGFAEVIQGSHEPGAVIKKSEVDGLEIMPAGTPITRPSELLSRPEFGRLLIALGELYDHIIIDTAPLLPVSDTHVLAGMMDGVIVSFNAEVDRDTIAMTQEILRRSRANIIGSVMNQVKYRQSGSYHRGKTAYDSYYNSPRGAAQAAKSDKLATVGKS